MSNSGFENDADGEPSPLPANVQLRRNGARMTHNDLQTLKSVQTKEESFIVQIVKGFQAFWAGIMGSFAMALPSKKVTSCDVNGHVFPKGTWDGEFPRCKHCGEQIKDANQFGGR
ncbi:hypothetical protein KBF38_25205 [bacterium]|jgi:hypothetical protein|nr:hypothetical protein [bacterium]